MKIAFGQLLWPRNCHMKDLANQKWMAADPAVPGSCVPKDGFEPSFDGPAVFPEYLSDVNVLVCPPDATGDQELQNFYTDGQPDPCKFAAISYIYIAWLLNPEMMMTDPTRENDPAILPGNVLSYLTSDTTVAFANLITGVNTWSTGGTDPSVYDNDLEGGALTAYRLREGIERFLITDNGPSHRGQPCILRLRKRWPAITVVHTPVHASWLNQVEVCFSIIQRKLLTS